MGGNVTAANRRSYFAAVKHRCHFAHQANSREEKINPTKILEREIRAQVLRRELGPASRWHFSFSLKRKSIKPFIYDFFL